MAGCQKSESAHADTISQVRRERAPSQDSASPPTIQPISLEVSNFRHATFLLRHSGVILQMDQVQTDSSSWKLGAKGKLVQCAHDWIPRLPLLMETQRLEPE